MAIVLPPHHPSAALGVARTDAEPVRIGIINIMPKLEGYERSLLGPLAATPALVEPVFLRLGSHGYGSSDAAHLDRHYVSFSDALARPLDGLIVTGAPVEELAFEDVHYWPELEEILLYARRNIACTIGLCWGGMALGRLLGVEKRAFTKKLFGVFEDRVLVEDHDLVHGSTFSCAHSRHSGMRSDELERNDDIRVLSCGEQSGYTTFESTDGRWFAHLGHPEYEGSRLAYEYARDVALGRTDVEAPEHFDVSNPTTSWRSHRQAIFDGLVLRASHERHAQHLP